MLTLVAGLILAALTAQLARAERAARLKPCAVRSRDGRTGTGGRS